MRPHLAEVAAANAPLHPESLSLDPTEVHL
jgi:hypothetical protein